MMQILIVGGTNFIGPPLSITSLQWVMKRHYSIEENEGRPTDSGAACVSRSHLFDFKREFERIALKWCWMIPTLSRC